METQDNVAVFKDAARRMVSYLATKGIQLQHAVALEALTQAVGSKNYRTFRVALERPVQVEKTAEAWSPGEPRWKVHADYDNGEHYCEMFAGNDALNAAVRCQLDRMSDYHDGDTVTVTTVIDLCTGRIADIGLPGDSSIGDHVGALDALIETAESFLGTDSDAEAEAAAQAIVFLKKSLQSPKCRAAITGMNEESATCYDDKPVQIIGCGLTAKVEPIKSIETLSRYVLDAAQVKGWAVLTPHELLDVYHAQALAEFYGPELRAILTASAAAIAQKPISSDADEGDDGNRKVESWLDLLEDIDAITLLPTGPETGRIQSSRREPARSQAPE